MTEAQKGLRESNMSLCSARNYLLGFRRILVQKKRISAIQWKIGIPVYIILIWVSAWVVVYSFEELCKWMDYIWMGRTIRRCCSPAAPGRGIRGLFWAGLTEVLLGLCVQWGWWSLPTGVSRAVHKTGRPSGDLPWWTFSSIHWKVCTNSCSFTLCQHLRPSPGREHTIV